MNTPNPASDAEHTVEARRMIMASPCHLILKGPDPKLLEEALLDIFHESREFEGLISRFLPDTEICILNAMAAEEPIRVESSTFALLCRCRDYYDWSEGAFDITATPLLELWDITGKGHRPTDEAIQETLAYVGMDKVLYEKPTHLMAFEKPGISLDLGGVGKGTAVDRAIQRIKDNWPITAAYVSFGGSTIATLGGPWPIEISSPTNDTRTLTQQSLTGQAMSMSSIGPRRFIHGAYDDEAVDHIIDPRTGRALTDIVNISVVAESAEAADALTTALVVLGEDKARETAAKFGATTVMFIRPKDDQTVMRTLDVASGNWTENVY